VQYQRLGLSHLGRALLDHGFAATPTSTHNIACKPLPYVFASLGLLPHMGRPPALAPQQQAEARQRRQDGATLKELAESYNVGIATISRLGSS